MFNIFLETLGNNDVPDTKAESSRLVWSIRSKLSGLMNDKSETFPELNLVKKSQ